MFRIFNLVSTYSLALVAISWGGGSAKAQALSYPVDVTVSKRGDILVADHELHAVLKYRDGTWETLVQGEGNPRTPLFGIRHIALDNEGACVASDPATMKVYRLSAMESGEPYRIEPIADDDSLVTPWGVLAEAKGGVLVVDRVTHQLKRLLDGRVDILATVRAPRAIVAGNEGTITVLTDTNLLQVGEDGTTTPLLETSPFEFPHDVVLHKNGQYYVSDGYARTIWRVSPRGEVSALASGPPLQSPQGMAIDAKGNLLVADAHARQIFRINPEGKISALGDANEP